jgi:macrodomain Ter protein organizer (MatP/YcbG family)
MKIIVAGSNTRDAEKICKENKVMKLYSLLNERKLIENWDDEHLLMVDSGAHSWNKEGITPVGMKRNSKLKPAREFYDFYLDFIQQHKDKKVVWVEFDVYGHLPVSLIDDFYDQVMSMNISGKFMRVYHPMLDDGSMSVLKKWMNQGHEYIGIGNDSTNMLDEIFHLTRDQTKLHGFAMTKLGLMEKYPFFSVDSTSPLSTVIFGRYTRPIMAFNERSDISEAKSIECFDDDWDRIENAIIETKKTEDYVTELWSKKGIQWQDLKF